jgi:SAM-dependent methyltransferase
MNQRPSHTRRWYPEVRFGGFTNVDGTVAFYTRVNSVLDPSFVVLDLGCGRGAAAFDPVPWRRALRQLKRRCDRVIGADVDPTAATNPFIDDFHLIEEGRIALPDGCVDVCVSDSVVEHVENVDSFFSECARVLRSGGYLFIRTPNVWGYPAIASRVVPHRFHAALVRRPQEDVFPTVYRCNSRRKLRRTLERHGFDSVVQAVEAEPGYLSFSSFLYALGVLHQRYAPSALRDMLFAYARKRGP